LKKSSKIQEIFNQNFQISLITQKTTAVQRETNVSMDNKAKRLSSIKIHDCNFLLMLIVIAELLAIHIVASCHDSSERGSETYAEYARERLFCRLMAF
jgi:hypothetical protein